MSRDYDAEFAARRKDAEPTVRASLRYAYTDGEDRYHTVFEFSDSSFGFGEIHLVYDPHTKKSYLDTEGMSMERVKRYVSAALDAATREPKFDENDPVALRAYVDYQTAMRKCGPTTILARALVDDPADDNVWRDVVALVRDDMPTFRIPENATTEERRDTFRRIAMHIRAEFARWDDRPDKGTK